jgi:cell division protein FtsB
MLVVMESSARRRLPIAAALLTASLMFSAIGLFFGLAATMRLVATRERRSEIVWLAPVAIVFGAWFLGFGLDNPQSSPATAKGNMAVLPLYVIWGLGASAAGLIGEGGWLGIPLLALAAGAVGFAWWRGGFDSFALGVALALVAFYAVTGLARGQIGFDQSGAGRYVYVGAVFWLILLADAARRLPWRGTWRPALAALLFLACFNSGAVLVEFGAAKAAQMHRQVADLQALAAERGGRCLNPNAVVDRLVMPQVTSPAAYYRAVDRYGDPTASQPVLDQADFDMARANLQIPACT